MKEQNELVNELLAYINDEGDDAYDAYEVFIEDVGGSYPEIEIVEREAGLVEALSEASHSILKYKGNFFLVPYSYSSYEGYDFYGAEKGLIQVFPKQKTITVYEP
jgi:hypothetical protein